VTVILSDKGWVRAAKGHDVDVEGLSYKAGDGYRPRPWPQQPAGGVPLHPGTNLLAGGPYSALRPQSGEPLTGRFALGAGEEVRHLVMGNEGEPYLICSDAGYGFVCKYDDLIGKNKNGRRC
jgi:topoisomerase-4 subunit A